MKNEFFSVPFARRALIAALIPLAIAGCTEHTGLSSAVADVRPVAAATAVPMRTLPDFSVLAEREGGAVVNIATTQKVRASAMMPPGMSEDDPMFEFFKRFGVGQGQQMPQGPQAAPSHGIGSGFIVSQDGYILTNAHVVADATEVTVKLPDQREFQAKVVGSDRKSDVALIKIAATGLPVVHIGNPDHTRVGEWVAAMGSPFGFENTITAGIVSGKARSLPDEGYVPFIQTDVAVNPGNSGGPLFNMSGEVIGINSQIYSRTGGYMGISFAIPIDVAMKVKDQLQQHGKVSRGKLGVAIQQVTKELADSFGMKKSGGALVSSVEPGSPADRAGLKSGDVIIGYNGAAIEKSIDLPRLVAETQPGQAATLRVWRNGTELSLNTKVGEMAGDKVASADQEMAAAPTGKLGVAVRPLSAEERKQVGQPGLLVEQSGGAAARAGIQEGDVILALNNEKVASVEQLKKALDKSSRSIAVLVQRGGATLYVPVNIG